MQGASDDPKAGERAYYARLGPDGLRHARGKPYSDRDCGKYLVDMGALLQMIGPPPGAVLDLGCGTGWTSRILARAGFEVLGVDISPDAIGIARSVALEENATGVQFVEADYEGFKSERSFDYALFYDSLHHAEDERAAVESAWRALRPGGVLFAFEPGRGHSRDPRALHAVETYGVHEKELPPSKVWKLGRQVGFRRALFLPIPHVGGRCVYRRDYISARSGFALQMERLWGLLRLMTAAARISQLGLTLLWK
jgi:SAM-dependent methyltransferase